MANHLKGLIAATYTPMHPDGTLNLDEVPKMVDYLIDASVQGLYICGSTGEGMSLTSVERCQLAEAFVAAASGRVPTIVHVGHNSLSEARQLAKHAKEIGADIISATAPSYYKIESVRMLIDSMAEVASGAPGLPFYYYHIPMLTGATLDMPSFLKAAENEIPNLAGLKYTAPTLHEFQACLELDRNRFDAVWGTDEMLLSALVLGTEAAIGSTYNITAPLNNELVLAYHAGDMKRARRLQLQSVQLIRFLLKFPFHAAVKFILSQFGIQCGACRKPMASLNTDQEAYLARELHSSGIAGWLFEPRQEVSPSEPAPRLNAVAAPHISALAKNI
jgi:N-acetylneuraminate lyase